MTHEYLRAVETYSLTYADLKRLARQSLEHSFLNTSRIAPSCNRSWNTISPSLKKSTEN